AAALEFYHKGLKIQEEIGDKPGIAQSYNNLGYIYQQEKDVAKALAYYEKSLKLREEINDERGKAETLNNLGYLYRNFGDPNCKSAVKDVCRKEGLNKALVFYQKSLDMKMRIPDSVGIAISYNNIGTIHMILEQYDDAIDYFNKSLTIRQHLRDKQGEAIALNNLGTLFYKKGRAAEAEAYCLRSLNISRELGFPELIKRSAESLKNIYIMAGKYQKAMDMFTLFITMRDSLNSQAAQKAAVQQQLQYEYERKAAEDSVRIGQEKKVIAVQLEHKRTQRYALVGGLLLVLIFAAFMFNRFRVTQRQKEIIEEQKHLVEEKQKEIVDSINYAQRIQKALLTSEAVLNDHLSGHFVYFRPKDIVSGDFYWASPLANGHFAIMVADSTGHGVPGAMMSMLNMSVVNEAISEFKLSDPAQILDHARTRIIKSLAADGSAEGGKDGMDCCLAEFDFKNRQLSYAAANNPIWIVRKEAHAGGGNPQTVMIRLPADKMPVGKHDKDNVPFTRHQFSLRGGDRVYLFTDGFADQFGLPAEARTKLPAPEAKGKKFKYKQLEELLLSVSELPMPEQKQRIDEAFNTWKGNLEQVDDVCIIGLKI
ncbi:MAG: tetratricopeptide repeat protein, partial [Bacteroidia bacterium]